jgi:acetamidase/formamidase
VAVDITFSVPVTYTASKDPCTSNPFSLQNATEDVVDLVASKTGIDRQEAYTLCSLAADLRITQVVNGSKGVHVMLEKRYLAS